MAALISLLIVVFCSLLITRVVSVALEYTGVSRDAAEFQASSAFSGAGFTTNESESVVNHPVRRRIILLTVRMGHVGVVTMISSFVLTFIQASQDSEIFVRFLVLVIGLGGLWFLSTRDWFNRHLLRLITWALERWTDLDVPDYANLLNLADNFRVVEMRVEADDWIANKRLIELRLSQEGVLILAIYRKDGGYVGTPVGDTYIYVEDTLILYGRDSHLLELRNRRDGPFGDLAHEKAVIEQQEFLEEQTHHDLESIS